ncbi:uncharacterized protein K460DRAFT_173711 [Cucurbitaria berberidis CBS 394.84]|uniref:Uncharacterized protein n=1 Tax=Cucurbitaria berberidis CBS 394.84 TaxID=1168544 RepID=A0A9P4GA67_9PLEO|nr:uncharacterized protein K460DRAFT_173711 [Cucurbitaria berberidis CBS 394.84]KAF1841799.1 hypothetical protein K460DRAFT_173711 [Cucurbitaria berberidis CBS 394.84]
MVSDFEVPRFLRELLTHGTRLHYMWKRGSLLDLSTRKRIALTCLSTPGRTLTYDGVLMALWRFWPFRQDQARPVHAPQRVLQFLRWQESGFDDDFPVIGHDGGQLLFFLPRGHENKIFKNIWQEKIEKSSEKKGLDKKKDSNGDCYFFGQLGYFDIAEYKPEGHECSPLINNLPKELKLKILRCLFAFKTKVYVVNSIHRKTGQPIYAFVVWRPSHLQDEIYPDYPDLPPGNRWRGPPTGSFFALAETNVEHRALVREICFGENEIVMPGGIGYDGTIKPGPISYAG